MIAHFLSIAALTPDASTLAMLMLGFGGFSFATFSVGMKVGQIVEAAWWKGRLQEALTSTREPSPRPTTLSRERRDIGDSPVRSGSLLRRPRLSRSEQAFSVSSTGRRAKAQ
jgi:hypothetical protein